jgi:hypothetical protein
VELDTTLEGASGRRKRRGRWLPAQREVGPREPLETVGDPFRAGATGTSRAWSVRTNTNLARAYQRGLPARVMGSLPRWQAAKVARQPSSSSRAGWSPFLSSGLFGSAILLAE